MRQKTHWSVLLQVGLIVVAVALLWLTLRTVAWAEVIAQLRRLQPAQILALLLANGGVLATFSLRWWLLLAAQGHRISYPLLILYRLITFAVSYFTPGPHMGGEPLQVYLVAKRHAVATPKAVAAVVLDRVLELIANFVFLAVGALLVIRSQTFPPWLEAQLLFAGLLLLLAPGVILLALARRRHPLSWLIRTVAAAWRTVVGGQWGAEKVAATALYRSIRTSEAQCTALCQRDPLVIWLALGASALSWLAIIGEFWLMTAVLGLGLTLGEALTALVAARVAILLPLPAGLGALEASQALAMHSLGLTPAAGVSMSILIRTRDLLLGLGGLWLGAAFLWRRRAGGVVR